VNASHRVLIFVGLNPSYADSKKDDPTLRRLIHFTCYWGYGLLVVVNLFARISDSPLTLQQCKNPIGTMNDHELREKLKFWADNHNCDLWLGWGVNGKFLNRNTEVMKLIEKFYLHRIKQSPKASKPMVIGLTKGGHPRHPLYVKNGEVLKSFVIP
tara:strand:+ start:7948 stop:8415 length:468 start_codon:yes stop_codon:yes gene_type:complete